MCGNPFRPPKPTPPPIPPTPPKVEDTPEVSKALTTQTAPTVAKRTQKSDTNGVARDEGSSRIATRKKKGRRSLRIPLLPEARQSLIDGDDSGINLPT